MPRTWVVVDTNVARSVGIPDRKAASMPSATSSAACFAALEALRTRAADHKDVGLAMSPGLKQEWEKHKSIFAAKWLKTMTSRGAFCWVSEPWEDGAAYRDAVDAQPDTARKELIKDEHVVALAMQTSQRVLSLDQKQRALLQDVRNHPSAPVGLGDLHWVAPDHVDAEAWILGGMPDTSSFTLKGA